MANAIEMKWMEINCQMSLAVRRKVFFIRCSGDSFFIVDLISAHFSFDYKQLRDVVIFHHFLCFSTSFGEENHENMEDKWQFQSQYFTELKISIDKYTLFYWKECPVPLWQNLRIINQFFDEIAKLIFEIDSFLWCSFILSWSLL